MDAQENLSGAFDHEEQQWRLAQQDIKEYNVLHSFEEDFDKFVASDEADEMKKCGE